MTTPDYIPSITTFRARIDVGEAFCGADGNDRSNDYMARIEDYFRNNGIYSLYEIECDTIWLPEEVYIEVDAITTEGKLVSLESFNSFLYQMIEEIGAA